MIKVAINGFGRIGQRVFRLFYEKGRLLPKNDHFVIVAINDIIGPEEIIMRMQRDSVYGKFPLKVSLTHVGGCEPVPCAQIEGMQNSIRLLQHKGDLNRLPWDGYDVDLVIDATGLYTTREQLQGHLTAGALKVLLTAPSDKDDSIPMFVDGVNTVGRDLTPLDIVSNASCTTNCVAPIVKIMDDVFGIEWGRLLTVHAVTTSQRIFDGTSKKDPRRARACMRSHYPTSTGAAKAIGKILPHLEGKIKAKAVRVPLDAGSYVFLDLDLKRGVTVEAVHSALQSAVDAVKLDGPGKNILLTEDRQFVSCDVVTDTHPCVVSLDLTEIHKGGANVALHLWYDNEMGYTFALWQIAMKMFFRGESLTVL